MNILFLTLAYPENEKQTNLFTDLMGEFKANGHSVTVLCQREKKYNKNTKFTKHHGINVLRVRTGNLTKVNLIEKGFSTLRLENQFIKAIKNFLLNTKFDLILYSTPPITFAKAIDYLKRRDQASTYLLLKDIFPQNAVDIGLIKRKSLIHKVFLNKEKYLYQISDWIGCMSQGNIDFILKHNPDLNTEKIEICPNSIRPIPRHIVRVNKDLKIRDKFNIPIDAKLFIYGGNLGKPQGIDFLLKALTSMKFRKDLYFLIIGSGTEFKKIEVYLNVNNFQNVKLINYLPKDEYDAILQNADVGLIFLDERFTIPNIPSRLTAYMEFAKPILIVTDANTDLDKIIFDAKCGFWTKAGDLESFKLVVQEISELKDELVTMGNNGRLYLEDNFHVSDSYKIIMSHFENEKGSEIMFREKILLITGGTGSFGHAVLNRFLNTDIKEIRIFSRDEKKQEDMRKNINNVKVKYYIGDVRDINSIHPAMVGVDYVFHAAALKQVPSCEFFPLEAVKTNVLGTENVLNSAILHNVKKVICLSTDKAVYPINAMGISKAMMEKVIVAKSRSVEGNQTTIIGTRYGNVLASRGSVIPLFIQQIKEGKSLTITDPNMTRFLMSLDDAVELVLFAFKNANQGDIFVQKAPASTIQDLAIALKDLFNVDNPIHVIGTRHGEKLYETLLTREEMAPAKDLGEYYQIPADNRDLNYDKFFIDGAEEVSEGWEYNSHNTHRLSIQEVKELLLDLEEVEKELKLWEVNK